MCLFHSVLILRFTVADKRDIFNHDFRTEGYIEHEKKVRLLPVRGFYIVPLLKLFISFFETSFRVILPYTPQPHVARNRITP